jgi:hypothetical protein
MFHLQESFQKKNLPFMQKCGKVWYWEIGHGWHYNTVHGLFMLDNKKGRKHILRTCNTLLFHSNNDYENVINVILYEHYIWAQAGDEWLGAPYCRWYRTDYEILSQFQHLPLHPLWSSRYIDMMCDFYVRGNLYCVLVGHANLLSCRGLLTSQWTCCLRVLSGR